MTRPRATSFPPLPETVSERTVPQLLQAAVDEAPDRTALIIGHTLLSGRSEHVSYADLSQRERRLAALEDRGVGPG